MRKVCIHCSSIIPDDAIYCTECGKKQIQETQAYQERTCPECGKVLDPDELFCSYCGCNCNMEISDHGEITEYENDTDTEQKNEAIEEPKNIREFISFAFDKEKYKSINFTVIKKTFFTCKGRIGCKDFTYGGLYILLIGGLAFGLLNSHGYTIDRAIYIFFNFTKVARFFDGVFLVIFSIFTMACYSLQIRRLHDLNLNSVWILVCAFFPVLYVVYLPYLMSVEGTKGPNQYGEDPLKL